MGAESEKSREVILMEQTLVIIKPDAMNRDLAGRVLSRFEEKGLKIVAMKMELLQPPKLKEHYAHLKEKPFYNEIIKYMSSIPSILVVLEGKQAVEVVRKMTGPTQGRDAPSGTIRGDFSMSNQSNLVHASDSIETAKNEIERFFKKEEIHEYVKMNFEWIYSSEEKLKK
ncbi:MAG TPA: nucleoside-diphosphate kinase [archaeon]|nr:nucleoside-diphosphate kinase [archaeon]